MNRRLFCAILALCLLASAARADTVVLRVLTVQGPAADISITLADEMFQKSAYEYDHALMQAAMVVSQAGFGANDEYGRDGDYDRQRYARDNCERMGFTDFRAWNYESALNDASDKVAYSIARKTLSDGSALLLVLIRSANYGAEWASNFHTGADGAHAGFHAAARGVVEGLYEYMAEHQITQNVKIWTTGYSRGAAVANVTAALLDARAQGGGEPFRPEGIFAYTFATPATVQAARAEDALYKNIFNIVSDADIVPELPLKKWGFSRYGNTLTFGKLAPELSEIDAWKDLEAVLEAYRRLTGARLSLASFRALRGLMDDTLMSMYANVGGLADYVSEWETLFMRLMRVANTKLVRDSISEETLSALTETYAGADWAAYALSQYEALSQSVWSSDALLALLSLYGDVGARALSRVSAMTGLLSGAEGGMYGFALTYMALSMMSAEELAMAAGDGAAARLGGYIPMLKTLAGLVNLFGGHMPDVYIAFLTTLDADALF